MKRLLPTPAVLDRVGRSKSWVYARIREGAFPAPVRPGLWLESEVEDWIDAQLEQRRSAA